MPDDPVLHILRKYEPLNAQVDLSAAGGPEADLMYRLITDENAFARYTADPVAELRAAGIDPERIDVERFNELARQLRERVEGRSKLPRVADSITQKETSEGQSSNFDHSSSWLMNKDGYNVLYDKGHDSSTSSSSEAGTQKSFGGIGIAGRDELLKHELNLLFFPAQPLVTPALIDEIRNASERGPQ